MTDVSAKYDTEQARNYDGDRQVEEHWQLENEYVRSYFSDRKLTRLLDVPVGTGRFLPYYRGVQEVVGVDASPEMLRMAADRIARERIAGAVLHEGNIFKLPYDNSHFDMAICWRLAHLFTPEQLETALAEVGRVTRGEILLQAYVLGAPLSRFGARLRRLPRNLLSRVTKAGGGPRWAHIPATFHSQETFERAFAKTALTIVSQDALCVYQGHDVCVFRLRSKDDSAGR